MPRFVRCFVLGSGGRCPPVPWLSAPLFSRVIEPFPSRRCPCDKTRARTVYIRLACVDQKQVAHEVSRGSLRTIFDAGVCSRFLDSWNRPQTTGTHRGCQVAWLSRRFPEGEPSQPFVRRGPDCPLSHTCRVGPETRLG